ncbi:MAG: ROK family transcriptional regulator [Planctomycetota bacterium]|nr:ROK family transcriptional regulator [Planctomycetota bacterium]
MSGLPSTLRWLNERLVFERLLRGEPASRADLAKATGLSAPTVGKVADRLLAAGLIEETETPTARAHDLGVEIVRAAASPSPGRPSRPLRLDRTRLRLLALQIGVRHTRLAALPIAGPADERWPVQFATPSTAATFARRLRRAAERVGALAGIDQPWAVMVSVPGVVDEEAGRVLLSPNLHWTEKADLPKLVRGVWDAPVCLVQEIRALALGQAVAEPEGRDFLLVDFGEGVGGAVVRDGRLHAGALPLSGELGHTPILGNDRACGCGAVGCAETLLSRSGILQTFARAHPRSPRTWTALARHVEANGIEPWLAETLDAAAVVIAGAINVLGLREVVVTGALTELPPAAMNRLASSLERSAMWARFGLVICRPAPRRRAAGLVAAAIDRVLMPAQGWQQERGRTLTGRTG